MAEFSESLTIRILGDSSQFQQELESVTRQITDLQSHLSRVSDLTAQMGSAFSQLAGMIRPLSQINIQLSQIEVQMRRINRIPLVINVAPALSALNALLGMLNVVIARMQAISSISASVGAATSAGAGAPASGSPNPRMNQGGLVTGASGVDRVPALLTAGEFVLRRSAVQELGTSMLFALNRDGFQSLPKEKRSGNRSSRGSGSGGNMSERLFHFLRNRHQKNLLEERLGQSGRTSDSTVNHHGDISIHVQQVVDVNALVRDMRFADYRLRNRRG